MGWFRTGRIDGMSEDCGMGKDGLDRWDEGGLWDG